MVTHASPELRQWNRLTAETGAVYHAIARQLGISDSALQILYVLYVSEAPCLLQQLCRLAALPKQTIHSALRKLAEDGMLTISLTDGKSKSVALTPAGQAFADQTAGQVIRLENSVFAALSPEDRTRYLELTSRFLADLRQKSKYLEKKT